MQRPRPNPNPAFWWQGILILLPVFVLAIFGIVSLRWDRHAAEGDARKLAATEIGKFAKALADEDETFSSYGNVVLWEAMQRNIAGLVDFSSGYTLTEAERDWQKWQQEFRDINILRMPFDPIRFSSNGVSESVKPIRLPEPPTWLSGLSNDQARAWHSANDAFFRKDWDAAEKSIQALLKLQPGTELRDNARFLLLKVETRDAKADELVTRFINAGLLASAARTETGLQLRELVLYELLARLPSGFGIPASVSSTYSWSVGGWDKSFFTRHLLDEGKRVAGNHPQSLQLISALELLCAAEARTLEFAEQFKGQHPPESWRLSTVWFTNDTGIFLAAIFPPSSATNRLFEVRFVPVSVVERAISRAIENSNIAIPEFADFVLEIGGQQLRVRDNQRLETTTTDKLPILASTQSELFWPREIAVPVTAVLVDPDSLYARQAQRSIWVGLLILGAFCSALIGFLAAYRSFRRQASLSEMKSNFVSSVSHELRAPIASVRLMSESLERDKVKDPAKQKEYFRFIGQECRRLSALIENVLDFSRIEQGRKQYEFEPTNIAQLVTETTKLMEPYATEKGVKLCLELDEAQLSALNPQPFLDGRAMQQALINLVDNAVKHSPTGEVVTVVATVRIPSPLGGERARMRGVASTIQISVQDHGPGIPRGEHEKIFQRFYRLGSELRRETQGIGIGLSIVQHIVEAHGGRVVVDSEVGKGSRFAIEVPVHRGGAEGRAS